MGQKSNLITLTKYITRLNFCNLNSKLFIYNLKFNLFLEKFLLNKNLNLFKITSLTINNLTFLTLNIFFRCKKIIRLKKKIKKKKNLKNNFVKLYKTLDFLNFYKKRNIFYLNVLNLNLIIKKKLLIKFYKNLQKYRSLYFQRVFYLFIDFIKVCTLFCQGCISAKNFLLFFNFIFKSISKKLHIRFIYFIKKLFRFILKQNLKNYKNIKFTIKGFKFIISGRLRDKQKSSFICLQEGVIPISNLNFGVDFSKFSSYTIYGVFGFKLWVFKDIL